MPAELGGREDHLDRAQRHTFGHISGHPLASNVKWRQVPPLREALGQVAVEGKDRHRVTIEDRIAVLHPSHHGDVSAETVARLRQLLRPIPRP